MHCVHADIILLFDFPLDFLEDRIIIKRVERDAILFHFVNIRPFYIVKNKQRYTLLINTGSSSNTIAVLAYTCRHVKENRMSNLIEVQTSARHVSWDENRTSFKSLKCKVCLTSSSLLNVSVQLEHFLWKHFVILLHLTIAVLIADAFEQEAEIFHFIACRDENNRFCLLQHRQVRNQERYSMLLTH